MASIPTFDLTLNSQSRTTSLDAILQSYGLDNSSKSNIALRKAIVALGEATANISHSLSNYVTHEYAGTQNASGDHQLELDLSCDKSVFDAVRESGVFATVASEETPHETCVKPGKVEGGDDDDDEEAIYFSLGCDPLDGSSIIDANFAVGSIYGIWPGSHLVGRTGREQVAAAVSVYGARTVFCIALPSVQKVFEVTLVDDRQEWHLSTDSIVVEPAGKIFAPGNLRATNDHPRYKALVQYWMEHGYQLRYSGGMVPDVYHIFAKSKGIFTNVSSPKAKAKLRLLYEVAPLGLIVECAGGVAMDETIDRSVLDIIIEDCDQRLGVCFGGTAEVEIYKKFMFA